MLLYIDFSGGSGGCNRSFRIGAFAFSYPGDDDDFGGENEERGLEHRPDGRGYRLRLDVERVPRRERAAVAALAREAVPHREGDGHELAGDERGAGVGAERPLEHDRPFTLV